MGKTANRDRLDINGWIGLAESDPAKFETLRAEAIEQVIESASETNREQLRRLQWRVDRLRERAANPMAATIAISEMMWDSFYRLHDSYQELLSRSGYRHPENPDKPLAATASRKAAEPAKSAQIISFPAGLVEV